MDAGLSRSLLFVRRPATSLRTKTKLVNGLLRAVGACWPSNVTPPSTCHCIFFISFKAKVMKEIKKIQWQVRWYWFLLVGGRWERFQGRVAGFYFQRVTLPVRFWVACGSPVQFRPRLPWWQPFVWRWLVISGAFGPIHPMAHHPLRRPSRRAGASVRSLSVPQPESYTRSASAPQSESCTRSTSFRDPEAARAPLTLRNPKATRAPLTLRNQKAIRAPLRSATRKLHALR